MGREGEIVSAIAMEIRWEERGREGRERGGETTEFNEDCKSWRFTRRFNMGREGEIVSAIAMEIGWEERGREEIGRGNMVRER